MTLARRGTCSCRGNLTYAASWVFSSRYQQSAGVNDVLEGVSCSCVVCSLSQVDLKCLAEGMVPWASFLCGGQPFPRDPHEIRLPPLDTNLRLWQALLSSVAGQTRIFRRSLNGPSSGTGPPLLAATRGRLSQHFCVPQLVL